MMQDINATCAGLQVHVSPTVCSRGQIWLAAQAAELYAGEEQSSEANKCRLKVPGTPAVPWRLSANLCHQCLLYSLHRALPLTCINACLHMRA